MKKSAAIFIFLFCCTFVGAQSTERADSLFTKAAQFSIANQNEQAAEYFEKALEEELELDPLRTDNVYNLLGHLSQTYLNLNQTGNAIAYKKEQISVCDLIKNRSDRNCLDNHIELASIYTAINDQQEALMTYAYLYDLVVTDLGENSKEFARVSSMLGSQYIKMQLFDQAAQYVEESVNAIERVFGKNYYLYDFLRNDLANIYMNSRRYEEAQTLFLDLYEHSNLTGEDQGALDGILLYNLAALYKNLGKFPESIAYYYDLLDILNKEKKKDYRMISMIQNEISVLYQYLGELDKALPLTEESMHTIETQFGKEDAEYGVRLNNLGLIYQSLGMSEKALELYTQSLENTGKTLGKNNIQYAIRLNNLGMAYQTMDQPKDALPYLLEAQEIIAKTDGIESAQYANNFANIAMCYQQLKDYDKALPLYHQAMELTRLSMGEYVADYIYRLSNLGLIYQLKNQYTDAIPHQVEAYEKGKTILGENHQFLGYIIINLAILYENLGKLNESFDLINEGLENTKNQIRRNFSFLSEQQKEKFLGNVNMVFNYYKSFLWRNDASIIEIPKVAYEMELLSKGLILTSSEQLRQSVENGNDPALLAFYDEWFAKRSAIAQQYALNREERTPELNKWEEEAETMERQLLLRSDAFQQTSQIGKITVKDVQNHLKNDEAAIEFVSFQHSDILQQNDTIYYYALVLNKNDAQPKYIKLTTQNEIDRLLNSVGSGKSQVDNLYRGSIVKSTEQNLSGIYNLIWKPLETCLTEGQTVWFAPSGTLNQIAFSAIVDADGKYLSDKYDLKQVSTTAKILNSDNEFKLSEIALFGGIRYDESATLLAKTANAIQGKDEFISRALTDDLQRGGESWNYLEGTLNEVSDIKSIAEKKNVKVRYFTGSQAMEEQFKAMNGKNSPQILHIATHGFFFPDPESNQEILSETQNNFKLSDNPLNRSGLLFAGANHSWKGEKLPDGLEDGILTAYEVSNVSLPNTRLVVLSACETGLGDIKGSEGVYGLQRSFKIAGADYLLMSLWQVPDRETAEFMEHFYQQLFAKQSIEKSYKETQNYMKSKYPGEPYKWAAFVLVR